MISRGNHRERFKGDDIMFTFMIIMLLLSALFGVAFFFTGAIFSVLFYLLIKIPVAILLAGLGLVMCCTIILIPAGLAFFAAAGRMLIPCV